MTPPPPPRPESLPTAGPPSAVFEAIVDRSTLIVANMPPATPAPNPLPPAATFGAADAPALPPVAWFELTVLSLIVSDDPLV